jgi:hypothetical protein
MCSSSQMFQSQGKLSLFILYCVTSYYNLLPASRLIVNWIEPCIYVHRRHNVMFHSIGIFKRVASHFVIYVNMWIEIANY